MVIRDVQHRRSPPRCRQDMPTREVKEEPEAVKPSAIPVGYKLSSPLRDEAHDGDFADMSWALVVSSTEI